MAIPVRRGRRRPGLRGRLVSCYNLFIVLDGAAACGVNIVCGTCMGPSARWRVSMGVAAAPAFLQLLGFFYLPESPRWLAQTGDVDGAARVLETLRGRAASSETIERDLQQLRAMEPEDVGDCAQGLSEVRRTPHLRATFGLGLGLMALQQFSGVNTIMYYGAAILIMCGFEEKDSVALTAVLALAQGLGIVVSLPLWERCGRRRLLIPSALAAAAAMACVALAFWAGIDTYKYVGLLGVVTYLAGFGLGLSSRPLGRQRGDLPDAPAGPRPGGGVHGELDRELRGGGDVFVAVQGARPGVHVRASQLYIVGGRRLAARGPARDRRPVPRGDRGPLSGALLRASPHGRRGRGPQPARRRRGRSVATVCRRTSPTRGGATASCRDGVKLVHVLLGKASADASWGGQGRQTPGQALELGSPAAWDGLALTATPREGPSLRRRRSSSRGVVLR